MRRSPRRSSVASSTSLIRGSALAPAASGPTRRSIAMSTSTDVRTTGGGLLALSGVAFVILVAGGDRRGGRRHALGATPPPRRSCRSTRRAGPPDRSRRSSSQRRCRSWPIFARHAWRSPCGRCRRAAARLADRARRRRLPRRQRLRPRRLHPLRPRRRRPTRSPPATLQTLNVLDADTWLAFNSALGRDDARRRRLAAPAHGGLPRARVDRPRCWASPSSSRSRTSSRSCSRGSGSS